MTPAIKDWVHSHQHGSGTIPEPLDEREVNKIWNDIRSTLASTAMKNMTIPQAKVFSAEATEYIGGYVRKLVDHVAAARAFEARFIELDLLEQAINAGRDMNQYKMQRLAQLQATKEDK
jgi:hypothetical protein